MPHYVTLPDGQRKAARPHGVYQEDFIAECIRLYEKPDDMETGDDEPGGEISEFMAVGQQIEKAYSTVMTQMENLIQASDTTDIEEMFLNDYLPEIYLSDFGNMQQKFMKRSGGIGIAGERLGTTLNELKSSWSGFSGTGEDTGVLANQSSDIFAILENEAGSDTDYGDFKTTSTVTVGEEASDGSWTTKRSMSDIDWSNGNLYVEYYYLIEDWETKPAWWDSRMSDTAYWSHRGHGYTEDSLAENYRYYGVVSEADSVSYTHLRAHET